MKENEESIEQRIMKSNLSDEDKIELIKRLNQQVIIYPYQPYEYIPAIYGRWEFTC